MEVVIQVTRFQPGESVRVRVEENTALVIINKTPADTSVESLVRGDSGLSLGYTKN